MKLANFFNEQEFFFETIWLDANSCGKKSDDVAEGIKNSMIRFGLPTPPKASGITVDSGAGTPESLAASLDKKQLLKPNLAMTDS